MRNEEVENIQGYSLSFWILAGPYRAEAMDNNESTDRIQVIPFCVLFTEQEQLTEMGF